MPKFERVEFKRETCRDIHEHEVFMAFYDDKGAEMFYYWWAEEGSELFNKYYEENKDKFI